MRQFRILSLGSACLAVAMSTAVFADDKKADPADAVLDSFVKMLQADKSVNADARTKALAAVAKLRKDKDTREFALTEALRELSPEFQKALSALGAEDLKAAVDGLKPLTTSKNDYLAAESRYYLARAYILQEKYELALPHLDKLDTDLASKSIRGGEAMFLKGASQLHLLKRKDAAKTLAAFLKKYPTAPERLRVAAWRQLEVLRSIGQGTLPDIHQHMLFSRRKLALQDAGKETQKVQQRIVAMLDKMIDEAEKKSGQCAGCKCGGSCPGGGSGNGAGQGQGSEKGNGTPTGGNGTNANKDTGKTPAGSSVRSPWDHLRKTKRDEKVFAALKARFPDRYRQLMEQYMRSLKKAESK